MKKETNVALIKLYLGDHMFKEETVYYDYDEKHMKKSWESNEPESEGPYSHRAIANDAINKWIEAHREELTKEVIESIKTHGLGIGYTISSLDSYETEGKETIHL